MHKIITITGLDRVGKETQSRLLTEVLKPSERMTAPDYDHWAGTIVSSILHQKPFYIGTSVVSCPEGTKVDEGKFIRTNIYNQGKHPQILQLLHTINSWDKQEKIKEGLKTHHWVMDRYIEDALAYGTVDGCSLDFLLELNRNFVQSNLVIVMLGSPYPRPGEVPDINERDSLFQSRVHNTYAGLLDLFPKWRYIDTAAYNSIDSIYNNPAVSMLKIHNVICSLVREKLGLDVNPMELDQLKDTMKTWASK